MTMKTKMNRHLLLWLIAITVLATVGCRPRHPPHTPQPFGTMGETGGPVFVTGHCGSPARGLSPALIAVMDMR